MSSSLDTIRYHSGIAGEEVAEMVDSLEREVSYLREQVERLTKAYDQCGRTVQDYGRTIDQTESRLREVATHCANVEQELAVIAEQNEKMREALSEAKTMVGHPDNIAIIDTALSLPDLATPVLNRIKAEGMREAAMHCSKHGSRTADEVSEDLFANADELEKSK